MSEPESEAEVRAFEEWLAADPDHGSAYAGMDSLASLSSRLPRRLLSEREEAPRFWLRPAYGLALALMLIVASAIIFTGDGRQSAAATIVNPGPSVRSYELRDGSTVLLDSGARIAVDFTSNERSITLQSGQARFRIADGDRRPFSIRGGQASIRTSPGLLDLSISGDDMRVQVFAGTATLTFAGAGGIRQLTEGRSASRTGRQVSELAVDMQAARWPDARLSFENARLGAIIKRANRHGVPKIQLEDASLGDLRVTGVLDIRDPRSLARKLAATLNLGVDERADPIRMHRSRAQ